MEFDSESEEINHYEGSIAFEEISKIEFINFSREFQEDKGLMKVTLDDLFEASENDEIGKEVPPTVFTARFGVKQAKDEGMMHSEDIEVLIQDQKVQKSSKVLSSSRDNEGSTASNEHTFRNNYFSEKNNADYI